MKINAADETLFQKTISIGHLDGSSKYYLSSLKVIVQVKPFYQNEIIWVDIDLNSRSPINSMSEY